MTRRVAVEGPGGAVRTAAAMLTVLAACLVVVLSVQARPSPQPYDPSSGQPDGTRSLARMLDELGGRVVATEDVPVGEDVRLLVIADRLDLEQAEAVLAHARRGGVVVVADPESAVGLDTVERVVRPLAGRPLPEPRAGARQESNLERGTCTIAALDGLRGLYVPDGVLLGTGGEERSADPAHCFGTPDEAFVLAVVVGEGIVVRLGDNDLLTNRWLRRADNAGLAAALLVPRSDTDVTIVLGRGTDRSIEAVGAGDRALRDLVPGWVWAVLAAGASAFCVFAVSRAVRPAKLLTEPLAVPLAASELVEATAAVMARAGHSDRARGLLVARYRRDLCAELGLDAATPDAELDARAAVLGQPSGATVALLASSSPAGSSGDAALVATAARVAAARRSWTSRTTTAASAGRAARAAADDTNRTHPGGTTA